MKNTIAYCQYLRQIEFNYKINFSDLIKSICYDSNIKYFYLIFEIGEGVIMKGEYLLS